MDSRIKEIEPKEETILEMLDECHEPVKIGGLIFMPSQIVKECDPMALRCMVADEPSTYECLECSETFDDLDDAEYHVQDEHDEGVGL